MKTECETQINFIENILIKTSLKDAIQIQIQLLQIWVIIQLG